MSMHQIKPHVSPALAHLRKYVTLSALALVVCCTLQMLVFGFVHFTQVRYASVERDPSAQRLSVVAGHGGGIAGPRPDPSVAQQAQPEPLVHQRTLLMRPLSSWDPVLHIMSDMACGIGIIAALCLAAFTLVAVAVAGGGCVPGIAQIVSSASWALVLGLACIPWRELFPAMPIPGVFSDYQTMAFLSMAADQGQSSVFGLFTVFLILPISSVAAAILALLRFRAGVADGIIVTSVSELDERLEREMANIRSRGVAASAPRSVAALNQAIGDRPVGFSQPADQEEDDHEPAPRARPPAADSPFLKPRGGKFSRRSGEADHGESISRPI